jgi:hypothetical protein
MPIDPLPVFEADADPRHREAMSDSEIYERLEPPKTIVVRFGYLRQIAEYPYEGEITPGCGSKLVSRTHRGTEIVEMLTTTCENSGCAKSVTRQEMLDYIEGSGGKDYPFRTNGKILHVATIEELNKQSALDSNKKQHIKMCKTLIKELDLPMDLVEVEPILGEELLTFYFMSKEARAAAGRGVQDPHRDAAGRGQGRGPARGRLRALWPALLLQEFPEGAQARLHEVGQAPEGHAGPPEDLRAVRPADVLPALRGPDVRRAAQEAPQERQAGRDQRGAGPRH